MSPKPMTPASGELFHQTLREQINLKHPLVRLADLIDWERIEAVCATRFASRRGRPATAPRLIAGLLYLQHAFDLSDEDVVWGWVENPYWQVFTGETYLRIEPPIDPSRLTRWRQRLGEEGIEELLSRTQRILAQRPKDKHRLYSLHAPEVECISKGKARTPYEFGVKVSITTTLKEGFVLGARSMPGNPYDGHTLPEALEHAAILGDTAIETAVVDRGYRGVEVPGTRILRSGQRGGVTKGLKAMIKRRSAIEPTIGHMRSDGKLDRSWLKGQLGDALRAILCGAGHNIRLLLRRLRRFCAYVLMCMVGVIGGPRPGAA